MMKKQNKNFGIVIMFVLVIGIIISSTNVSALGITPASQRLFVDELHDFDLQIINNQNQKFKALVYVDGELSRFIKLNETEIEFKPNDLNKFVRVSVNIPNDFELSEGNHINLIKIRQVIEDDANVAAQINLNFPLNIFVPYKDEALEIKFDAGDFNQGQKSNFVIFAKSVGEKNVENAFPAINIFDSSNQLVHSIEGPNSNIVVGTTHEFIIPWEPNIPNGKYLAVARIDYATKNIIAEKEFVVGSPKIHLENISAEEFELGSISKFDIFVKSNWAEKINDVYIDFEILNGSQKIYSQKSVSKDVESLGNAQIPVFLDSKYFGVGEYQIRITMNYLGTYSVETFSFEIEENAVLINDVFVAGADYFDEKDGLRDDLYSDIVIYLMVFVLILLILMGIYKKRHLIVNKKRN